MLLIFIIIIIIIIIIITTIITCRKQSSPIITKDEPLPLEMQDDLMRRLEPQLRLLFPQLENDLAQENRAVAKAGGEIVSSPPPFLTPPPSIGQSSPPPPSHMITQTLATFTPASAPDTYFATIGSDVLIIMCNFNPNAVYIAASPAPVKLFEMVHGLTRDMKGYYSMASKAWSNTAKTNLVWAPRFVIASEKENASQNAWSDFGWVQGSASTGGTGMTSYEFSDVINRTFLTKYPTIKTAYLTGHSSGGQYAARYTGLSVLPDIFPDRIFYYCIISPSTFLWLTADRPVSGSTCSSSNNNWFLGLDRLNEYAAKVGAERIKSNYMNRNVIAICGTQDVETAMLDQSCGANAQGANRYERYKNFVAHMQTLGAKTFYYTTVPSGHGVSFGSDAVKAYIVP